MRIFILFLFLNLFLNTSFAEEPAKDIYWNEEKGILSYNIPKDSQLKIRVGSADGPIYRTLVNLEKRKAGMNQEVWNGRDELGLIDFKDYGPLHFCVDPLPRLYSDLNLLVIDLPQTPLLKVEKQPLSLKIDINEKDREWFCKEGIEIMVFLDKRLIKLKKVKALPYSLDINFKTSKQGKHLLTLNVWSGDHASVAYKNVLITLETEKKNPLKKKVGNPNTLSGKMVYCQHHKDFWQVCIANLNGSRPRQLTKSPVDKRYPSFSPDAKRIAYTTNGGEMWIMDRNGKNNKKVPLPIHASQPRWSSDAKRIVFVSYQDLYYGGTELWEVNLKTLKLKKLTNRPWMQYDPRYSPDGTNILFTDGPELYAQEIRKLDLKTGDITQLTENGPYDYDMQPAYLNNGESIVYTSKQDGNYDIWIMDKFGRRPVNLTKNPAYDIMPFVDEGGNWIFFLSDRSGALEVWRMEIDGSNLLRITKDNRDKQDLSLYAAIYTKNN